MSEIKTPVRMQVAYEPENEQTGIVSRITWDNPDLHRAIEQAFGKRDDERIVRVEVTRDGLKAIFEYER